MTATARLPWVLAGLAATGVGVLVALWTAYFVLSGEVDATPARELALVTLTVIGLGASLTAVVRALRSPVPGAAARPLAIAVAAGAVWLVPAFMAS